jgi:hypothetical protein
MDRSFSTRFSPGQHRFSPVTTEGDEVKDATVLEADKPFGHGGVILHLG